MLAILYAGVLELLFPNIADCIMISSCCPPSCVGVLSFLCMLMCFFHFSFME